MGHKELGELQAAVEEAKKKVVVGSFYAHYKHPEVKAYVITAVGLIEATEEVNVVYTSLEHKIAWIRPLINFLEEVEVDGKSVPRFKAL